jgi:hypothetical protein
MPNSIEALCFVFWGLFVNAWLTNILFPWVVTLTGRPLFEHYRWTQFHQIYRVFCKWFVCLVEVYQILQPISVETFRHSLSSSNV